MTKTIALAGNPNVGKSTLMRLLTKADVLAEDKLFATVDATVRKMVVHSVPFLISDTVGFISSNRPKLMARSKYSRMLVNPGRNPQPVPTSGKGAGFLS